MEPRPTDWQRLREKLRDAARSVGDADKPLAKRLEAAYVYALSGLEADDFPDQEGAAEFRAIDDELSATGEAIEGAGSVPTTTWLMDEGEAAAVAARIVALATRYDAL